MARIIIDNTCLVVLSDAELEEYGNEFEKLCHDSRRPMTFERFCLKKALDDLQVLTSRRYQESIWHLEVERELKRQTNKTLIPWLDREIQVN